MKKVWHIQPREDADLFQHILKLRGIPPSAQSQFFNPDLDQLSPPTVFADIETAVSRIGKAIDDLEPIAVWGDFDADGVTSTAILWETLHQLGAKVQPYIPNRDTEGHGFSVAGLEHLAEKGIKLILTVDHGITGDEGIAKAAGLGIEVIVSDHHEPHEHHGELVRPAGALATIHPLFSSDPQPMAGCGVSYVWSYAIWLDRLHKSDNSQTRLEFADSRLELAAIGTIADLVPLTGNNRIIAALGLKMLAESRRQGLRQLMSVAGIKPGQALTMYDVGFLIAPRLNAPGRLADALDSLRLLCTKSPDRARLLAESLQVLNQERQRLLGQVSGEALAEIAKRGPQDAYVVSHPDWPAGVCGLAASRVVEATYRPAVVMEDLGEMSRGSARSIKGFDFTAALNTMPELFERFGGHAMAAGFSCKTENIPEIERRLGELVRRQLTDEQLQPSLQIDAEATLSEMDQGLVEHLKRLEPCGMGNPSVVFAVLGAEVVDCKAIGNGSKHLKLKLRSSASSPTLPAVSSKDPGLVGAGIDAIAFGFGEQCDELSGQKVDVAFCLEENVWNGKTSLQLKVKDVRLSGN